MIDENILKNIIREIMRECTNRGIIVVENFVKYYVKLLVLNPHWKISENLELTRANVQKFVKFCVSKFSNQHMPSIVTLKMQLYFSTHFDHKEEMVLRNRQDLQIRLSPLLNEIVEVDELENDEQTEKYKKKIIYYITLLSGLGNPTCVLVYKEVETALGSVFFPSDFQEYFTLTKVEKENHLTELMQLVTGIRIFNRDCRKGGQGIEDLPKMLQEAVTTISMEIQRTLLMIMEKVNLLTTAIDYCYKIEYDEEKQTYFLSHNIPEITTLEKIDYYKELLLVYRQYELYVRKVLVEVEKIDKNSSDIFLVLRDILIKIHETVHLRTAIPVGQVYPLFVELAGIWGQMQDETILLAKLSQMLYNLSLYVKQFALHEHILTEIIGAKGALTDAERLEQTTGMKIPSTASDMSVLEPHRVKDFDKLPLQYLGFCAWKLVEMNGALIPGNPNMGVGHSSNMYFVFSSPQAAEAFGKAPETFILKAFDMARSKPELIHFLQIHEHLERLRNIGELVIIPPEVVVTYEADMQTEMHPVSSRIDQQYMWNIWDWKRQALMLANISRCLTHSTQTVKSNYRNPAKIQTHELRNKHLQTKKDNYTNVPTLSNFIYGLRGRKDNKQFIVTLTRPVDQ